MGKAKKSIREVVAANLRALMDRRGWSQNQLASKSGVSQRHISKILTCSADCTTRVLGEIARPFGAPGWVLMLPNLNVELLESGDIQKLVEGYSQSSREDQQLLVMMSARGAAHAEKEQDEQDEQDEKPPPPTRNRLKPA